MKSEKVELASAANGYIRTCLICHRYVVQLKNGNLRCVGACGVVRPSQVFQEPLG